ncbi:MAG: UPF0182 family protein [Spirochaetes bacterium]|nr:UPF0182 family protein [Spirochaetota bacterium]
MNKKIIFAAAAAAVIFFIFNFITGIFLDFEWFNSYGHSGAFWTLFFTEFNVHVIFTIIFFLIFLLNIGILRLIAGRNFIRIPVQIRSMNLKILQKPGLIVFLIIISAGLLISYIMGSLASSFWKEILLFINRTGFENMPVEPVFSNNAAFYMFSLPFYKFLYGWILGSVILLAFFSGAFHFFNGTVVNDYGKISFASEARSHLSLLLALFSAVYGFGFKLSSYSLLLKERGKFFGAGYSDVNSQLFGYKICMILCFAAAVIFIFNIFKKSIRIIFLSAVIIIPSIFAFTVVIPAVQQRFFVVPNELDRERPFIENNIRFTRSAYDISKIEIVNFKNEASLTLSDIEQNRTTLNNIRLWDWKPLQQTYKQLQELKPYYTFMDVDIDRYMIDGNKVAVNLSAREISTEKLAQQTQTWVNKHLIYTHGYGLVMSRVDTVTPEGLPDMIIRDIPPKSSIGFTAERPEIYYGEHSNGYIMTNTAVTPGEFNYPSGDTNNYSVYDGTGGIKVGGFFKRLFFALSLKDLNILISTNIKSDSRILFRRNILDMVNTLTPYLMFDEDPYLVLSEGKLFWIIDGYTVSNQYPYSTPYITKSGKKINYIRNSVKVVIDAYNGSINYYISDNTDPMIITYSRIFPTIFKNAQSMPEDIKSHLRYPETLFSVQSSILLKYHMQDANVFYNNEDLWNIPEQIYAESRIKVEPSYLVTKLPDEQSAQFIMMLPFTPANKDNMVGFLTANCDRENYGRLKLYSLPKQSMTYGPMQIEARINQDAEISKQLTLWNQKGSQVIRGNITVLPINSSLLFIEPLYLKADTSEMPELKRVIISFSDKIVMAENLNAALDIMFSGSISSTEDITEPSENMDSSSKELIKQAYDSFQKAEEYIKNGDWENYGREIKNVKNILSRLNSM